MERNSFEEILAQPYGLRLEEKVKLQGEVSQYPFSALLRTLDMLADKSCGIEDWTSAWSRAELYLVDPKFASESASMVSASTKVESASCPEPVQEKPADEKPSQPTPQEDGEFDIMKEINAYQEVSFKTAPKSVILSNFLKSGGFECDENDASEELPIEVLGKKSIAKDSVGDTETLAVILEKQGKFAAAIEIYQKLILKYPEKSSIFATRIKSLETQIENYKK